MAVLTPVLTGGNGIPTYNLGIAETYSWIPIQNDQNRPMFARAGYITNLSDLTISLSAGNLNIGSVKIQDGIDGALASVVQAGTNYALLVQTQDLVSTLDSITIGDKRGNAATVTNSGVNVNVRSNVSNWDTLSASINTNTFTTLPSNLASVITILNYTGDIIYIKNAAKSLAFPLANNLSVDINLIGNTNEVAIRSNSQTVTVYGTFTLYV